MSIMPRIDLIKEYGLADSMAYDDLVTIVGLMDSRFGITLTEDNAGVMITHIAAAFQRNTTGEAISPLVPEVVEGLRSDESYVKACEILDVICSTIKNPLSEAERDFVLLHLCSLVYTVTKKSGKEEAI